MGLGLHVKVLRLAGAMWVDSAGLVVIKRLLELNGLRRMNVAVKKYYFLSRPIDEEGKPIRGYRKRMYGI